jgi:hypothetical protein
MTDVTEFDELNPTAMALVSAGANGFPVLMAKARATLDEVATEEAVKQLVDGYCGSAACSVCKARAKALDAPSFEKARLKAKERNALPDSAFALPDKREYPIHDEDHARAALSMLHNASPEEQSRIKAAVHRRYPDIGGDDVSDEAAKQTAPDKGVPRGEAQSQTNEMGEDAGSGVSPDPEDGGEATRPAAEHERPPRADGQGDTAPDKTVPRGEAQSQTAGAQKDADVDLTGDKAGAGGDAAATSEAESQTDEVEKKKGKKKSKSMTMANPAAAGETPGSPEWEHHDVALGQQAGALVEQLGNVVHTFTQREQAEGGASKALPLSENTAAALRRAKEVLADLTLSPSLTKEIEDMDATELTKLLDERDAAARRAAKADAKAKKAKKKNKMPKPAMGEGGEGAAAEDAEKASKAADPGAAAATGKVSKATLAKDLAETKALVEKMSKLPGAPAMLNGAGVTAMLRGPERENVFKMFDDHVAELESAVEKAGNAPEARRLGEELRQARQQRTAAKLIAQANSHERDPGMIARRMNNLGVPVVSNRHALGPDSDLHGVGGRGDQ